MREEKSHTENVRANCDRDKEAPVEIFPSNKYRRTKNGIVIEKLRQDYRKQENTRACKPTIKKNDLGPLTQRKIIMFTLISPPESKKQARVEATKKSRAPKTGKSCLHK